MYPSPEGWGIIEGVVYGTAFWLALLLITAVVMWLRGE